MITRARVAMVLATTVLTLILVAACTQRPSETSPNDEAGGSNIELGTPPAITGDEQQDFAALERMKEDARALANANGCSEVGQCRTAPLGAKPCGGPWEYILYCSVSTDSVALYRRLEMVRQFEDSLNRRYVRVSTCDMAMPPQVTLEGNACRAANPSP